jgi:hypothetical protein
MNYKQIYAIEQKNKQRILAVNPKVPEASGIYIFNREENGFKYAYVGQAKNLLQRLAQHLDGYQHIDFSIKKRGLWNKDNPCGWRIWFEYCHIEDLDEREKDWIRKCAFKGYQLYNHTLGGQGEGKRTLGDAKSPKGYYDGLQQGYKNAQKFVANLFDKHLEYSQKSKKPNKNQEKAMAKFKEFLDWNGE